MMKVRFPEGGAGFLWQSARGGLRQLFLLLALVASEPALAHAPYFTRVEKVVLPDGQPGEMRLLNGDGVITADPARILVLDGEGRLLARSRRSQMVELLCEGDGRCRGIDFGAGGEVLELDPASFRGDGPLVPGFEDSDRRGLWELESGDEDWGFKARRAHFRELVRGEAILARKHPILIPVLMALGFVATGLAAVGLRRPPLGPIWPMAVWTAGALMRLAGCAAALLLAATFAAIAGLPGGSWLASLLVGVAGFVLLRRLVRRPASAAG